MSPSGFSLLLSVVLLLALRFSLSLSSKQGENLIFFLLSGLYGQSFLQRGMDIFLIWCKVHVFPQESCLILTAGLVLLSSWGRCQVGPGPAAPCCGWARSWGWRQGKHSSALPVQWCSPMVFEPVVQTRTPDGNWDHLRVQWLSGTSCWWARAEAKLGNQVSRLGSKVQGWAQAYLPHSSGADWGQSPELECSSQASGRETPIRLLTALTEGCKATPYQSRQPKPLGVGCQCSPDPDRQGSKWDLLLSALLCFKEETIQPLVKISSAEVSGLLICSQHLALHTQCKA